MVNICADVKQGVSLQSDGPVSVVVRSTMLYVCFDPVMQKDYIQKVREL